MITHAAASLSCLYAWRRTGMSAWLFMAGVSAGFAYDSWLLRKRIIV